MKLRPRRMATFGTLAGILLISSGMFGEAVAATRGVHPPIVTAACATRPATTVAATPSQNAATKAAAGRVTSAYLTSITVASSSPSATATPSLTPTVTPSPSASPTKSATQSPSPGKSATSPSSGDSPTPSDSPTASTSPSPSKSPTATPTASPTPTGTPKKAKLCVSVQPFSVRSVRPGKTATYAIWVWTTAAAATKVSVSAVVGHLAHVSAAKFTVCPAVKGTACQVGNLPVGQADELQASVKVASAAAVGKKVKLTATVTGKSAVSFHAAASVLISTAPTPKASPSPTTSTSVPSIPAVPAPTVPALPGGFPAPVTGATNPVNLFPTVSPGTATPTPSAGSATGRPRQVNAIPASATVPLNPRLIGGQLAGLAVLAGAIVIAIARLSLRAPKPQGSKTADD